MIKTLVSYGGGFLFVTRHAELVSASVGAICREMLKQVQHDNSKILLN